jgi:hypothetical protein
MAIAPTFASSALPFPLPLDSLIKDHKKAYFLDKHHEAYIIAKLSHNEDRLIARLTSMMHDKIQPTASSARGYSPAQRMITSCLPHSMTAHQRSRQYHPQQQQGSSHSGTDQVSRISNNAHQILRWRVQDLDISKWTSVVIPVDTVLNIIIAYLEIDHPVLGFFDAQAFLDSFFGLQGAFCSPLLINSLLAYASVSI